MDDKLSPREMQVLELLAWGAERKEVPGLLKRLYGGRVISVNTVHNIVANIYSKLSLQNEKELSAWYFCECRGIDAGLSPLRQLRRTLYALFFIAVLIPQLSSLDQALKPVGARITQVTRGMRIARSSGRTLSLRDRRCAHG